MPRKMKESGVEWLGQIPEGWNVLQLKGVCTCNDEVLPEDTPKNYRFDYVDIGAVKYGQGIVSKESLTFEDAPSRARRKVLAGDVIVSTVRTYLKSVALISAEEQSVVVSTGFAVLRPSIINSQFLFYLANSQYFSDMVESWSTGISYPSINAEDLLRIKLPFPSLPEQERIAAFLDERCAKIDGMIAEAKASIEDYNIYRQDVIDCLANFGSCSIDRVKVRDSGNVWLNKVPDAWDVLKIGLIFKENCRAPKDEDIPLSLSQKDGLIPTDLMQEHSLKTSTYENWKRVLPDDLVLNRFKAHLGVFYASQYTGMVSFHYGVFVARRPLSVKYYEYLFHSTPYRRMFAEFSNGITVGLQNLSNSSFYSARCVCPPVDVQRRIAAELDEKCAAIDKLVGEKEALIADLEAYKKSLIFETVTGKREVA